MPNTSAPYSVPGITFTVPSGADLSSALYCCAKLDASGKAILTTAVGDTAIGVFLSDPNAADMEAVIGTFGIYIMKTSAAIAEGAKVTPEAAATGRIATSSAANDWIIGVALGESAGANEYIPVLVGPMGHR